MKTLFAFLIVGALGLGACSTTKSNVPTTTSIDTSSTKTTYDWRGLTAVNSKLVDDETAVASAARDENINRLVLVCARLENDASNAKAFIITYPSPNVALNSDLERSLTYEILSAQACQNGQLDASASYMTEATTFIQKASADLSAN